MNINEKSYLTNYQLIILIIGFLFGSTTITVIGKGARQDQWLAFLIALAVGSIIIYGYSLIAKLNPRRNLVEILEIHFGKVIGKIISVLYIWYFVHLASLVFRNYGEFITTVTFTETPVIFISIVLGIVVAYATKKGINNAGRTNEILIVILLCSIIFVNLIVINQYNLKNLLPVLENGIGPVLKASFSIIFFPFGEMVVFLMIFPYLKNYKEVPKLSIMGTLVIGFFILSIIFRNISILGPDYMAMVLYPTHTITTLTRNFSVEPIFDLATLTGGGAKLGILMFAACSGIAQLFKIKDFRPLVLPVTAFVISLSIWVFPNTIEMLDFAGDIWPYYSMPFEVFIPLLLLISSIIRRKKLAKG